MLFGYLKIDISVILCYRHLLYILLLYSRMWFIYLHQNYWYNRNTLWLRDMVRQTSRGKSAAARPTAGPPRPLTSRGMSAWPYRVTTSIPFIQYAHIRCWIKNNCANCALKREIQWFDDELFTHTCMTSPVKRADVTCQVKPGGRRPDPLLNIPRTAPGP